MISKLMRRLTYTSSDIAVETTKERKAKGEKSKRTSPSAAALRQGKMAE